ncbi:hypothetical protein C4D60_Mb07t25860 [Musa balbisiana]|uniref:Uncharacterized protein n=1 Tax=Musa balbisiana TaxID=52838 RepID=A0A4S8JJA9_MUSBA|nr:hypothetical protein C4D60_Mb07t25860 [Musa balbisiana]
MDEKSDDERIYPPCSITSTNRPREWYVSPSMAALGEYTCACCTYLDVAKLFVLHCSAGKLSDTELRDTYSLWSPLNSMGKQAMAYLEEMNKHVVSHMTRGPALSSLSLQLPPPI